MRTRDWEAMIVELGRRGRGDRESGAFLLADRDGHPRIVTRVIYLDDLDPNCLTGGIEFDGLAYSKLWDLCDAEQRRVVGDVHTHPGSGVRQSRIDAANPMIARRGHIAVIVPNYASRAVRAKEVGLHLYDGEGWQSWLGRAAARRLFIRRWP
jgi:proteasome lid subunit RPN8/RPN11